MAVLADECEPVSALVFYLYFRFIYLMFTAREETVFLTRPSSSFSASKVPLCGIGVSLDGMELRLSWMASRLFG